MAAIDPCVLSMRKSRKLLKYVSVGRSYPLDCSRKYGNIATKSIKAGIVIAYSKRPFMGPMLPYFTDSVTAIRRKMYSVKKIQESTASQTTYTSVLIVPLKTESVDMMNATRSRMITAEMKYLKATACHSVDLGFSMVYTKDFDFACVVVPTVGFINRSFVMIVFRTGPCIARLLRWDLSEGSEAGSDMVP